MYENVMADSLGLVVVGAQVLSVLVVNSSSYTSVEELSINTILYFFKFTLCKRFNPETCLVRTGEGGDLTMVSSTCCFIFSLCCSFCFTSSKCSNLLL